MGRLKKIIAEPRVFNAVVVFLVSYVVLSILWIPIKDAYGFGVTFVASKFVAELKDADIEGITGGRNLITATFGSVKGGKPVLVDVSVKVSTFAFSVPIIMAALAALYPFLERKKRAFTEAFLILLVIHILHVFSLGALQLTKTFMDRGVEGASLIVLTGYHFLWGTTEYAAMSFGPFLIIAYVFLRFGRKRSSG